MATGTDSADLSWENEESFAPYQPRTEEHFANEAGFPDELEAKSESSIIPQPRTEERFATEAESSIIPAANNAIVSTSLKPTVAGLTFQVDIYDMITAIISAYEVYYCRKYFIFTNDGVADVF